MTADDLPPAMPQFTTRRRRVSKWDRPPEPHDWRWVVGGIGKALITIGLLMFGFVAYQLWGTGVETARAQSRLQGEFDQLLAASASTTTATTTLPPTTSPRSPTSTTPDSPPASTTVPAPITAPDINWANGSAVARIEIPSIDVDKVVVEGVRDKDLREGPGHFPESPMPGQLGNSAIAGHRTTFGAPFGEIDEVELGDELIFTTPAGTFVYAVTDVAIVAPEDYGDVIPTTDPTEATVTLVSCHPKYTARQRIIVYGTLIGERSPPPMAPPANLPEPEFEVLPGDPPPTALTTSTVAGTVASTDTTITNGASTTVAPPTSAHELRPTDEPRATVVDPLSAGWFDDPAAWPHVIGWALVLALVAVGSHLISRRLRNSWIGTGVGIVPFVVALWFFYGNVLRLLPAAI
jgi:sortase A